MRLSRLHFRDLSSLTLFSASGHLVRLLILDFDGDLKQNRIYDV